ncbi:hypothetical protein L5849_11035 [Erythrobacter sp. SN021]|uniref:hypothetical protein n=1 Tax=Erythrobacter sp. SN021 TaxID=2912574 RepID=UPI001F45B641|nr:hypothetical protein [Erythrobacter sp. SN021]MCF8883234.1 hypothetical protein [Erythrobacter sp. SN021]
MRTKLVAASAAFALFATLLAACGSAESESPDREIAMTPEATAMQEDNTDLAPNPVETNPEGDAEAPDIAAENCIEELARIANQPTSIISVERVEVDQTGPTHFLTVEGAAAPWACKTLPNASVAELYYTQEG